MINFRYHVVSLVAVFLALGIGVIMGSAVIDRAIVDRLEDQQRGLRADIEDVEQTNEELRAENHELRETAEQLTEEGSQRLLTGTLGDVPVLTIATRGIRSDSFDALLSLLQTSGATSQGTIWLTDRLVLDDDDEVRDLRAALDAPESLSVTNLRRLALSTLSITIRAPAAASPTGGDDEEVGDQPALPGEAVDAGAGDVARDSVFVALRDAGFVDFDPSEDATTDDLEIAPGTRVVLVSGESSDVPADLVPIPLAARLVERRAGMPDVPVLVAEDRSSIEEPDVGFVAILREDDALAGRLSTVDNIGDFAGRLASVLALVDLEAGRVGHFGRGPGAQRLLPAPPEGDG